jgi:tRNA1Val (adenine37-N6)-methyltransferase
MSNTYFQFKQFTIYHDRCAMKVGTDGVLLGAWTDTAGANHILDVGTGSGLIALMLAQRSEASIDAVEIDSEAALQAQENADGSPWKSRVFVHHDAFAHFAAASSTKYDLVVSNPPFFRNSLKPPAGNRSLAKHDTGLPYNILIEHSARILHENGRFCMIIPADERDHFSSLADFNGLSLSRCTNVCSYPGKKPVRCLLEFTRKPSLPVENNLAIRISPGVYSEEYIKLTKEFYL